MYKSISIRNKNVSVRFHERRIGIISDEQLLSVVTEMPEAATDELVSAIKKEYHNKFNKDFEVADASMAVEIWGHVYAESFAAAIKSLSPFGFVDSLADKVIGHCEVIDMGESGRDNNRFIWDRLASFKSSIAGLLPKTTA